MGSILQDIRIAARMLTRAPTFAVTVIATLTVSIGASLATFSAVGAVLLHKLPYLDSDRVVLLTAESSVSIPDGIDWRDRTHTLADVALFLPTWDFDLTGLGAPERLNGVAAEPRLFRILGTRPLLGRLLTDADDRAGGPHVVVITQALWHRRFAADPTIVGQSVTLNGHPTTIVGVMPDAADVLGGDVELWVPQAVETPWAAANRGSNNFAAVGRLAPGVSLDAARTDLRAISGELAAKYPNTNTGKIITPVRLLDAIVGSTRAPPADRARARVHRC